MEIRIRYKGGFSMIELMVVIAILAVMTGMAVPALLAYMPKTRVNSAARELSVNIQWAKMKAISEGKNYYVALNTTNNSYDIYSDNNNDNVPEAEEVVRSVNIPGMYKRIQYGYVAGKLDPAPVPLAITASVSFADSYGLGIPAFQISSRGTLNEGGYIYFIPSDAVTGDGSLMRAVSANIAGSVKVLSYNADSNIWE